MSESFTGTITKVRKDRKGFFIDGAWYSVYDQSEMDGVNKGDNVTFTFKKKGDWNNIDNGTIKTNAAAPAQAATGGKSYGGGNSQFRSVPELNRIDGLRFAVEAVGDSDLAMNLKEAAKAILALAPVFTAFIDGTLSPPVAGATGEAGTNAADAAAKEAAEAAAEADRIAAKEAAEAAAKAQQAAGQSALDDFLGT